MVLAAVLQCCCFLAATGSTLPKLRPAHVRINRQPASTVGAAAVDGRTLSIAWDLLCDTNDTPLACRGQRQTAYRIVVRERDSGGVVVLDTGACAGAVARHVEAAAAAALRSARHYELTVHVWSTGGGGALPHNNAPSSGATTGAASFRTALLGGAAEWQGEWLGGATQLRGAFELRQPRSAVASALAHAAGVGCFALTLNGEPTLLAPGANRTYMDPGWANVPTVRSLYMQYDVASLLRDGANVLGARLGFCKYGYQGSFCTGAHGSLPACRAFNLHLVIVFKDGTQQTVASGSNSSSRSSSSSSSSSGGGSWLGTTALNPIRYTHLYHGETADGRVGDRLWDSPDGPAPVVAPGHWQPAEQFATAAQLGTTMSLLSAPPMQATDQYAPVHISAIPVEPAPPAADPTVAPCAHAGNQARVVPDGGTLSLSCYDAGGSATIKSVEFARWGYTNTSAAGRFIGGGSPCADPAFVPGCIFWEAFATRTKHFVETCVVPPCGVNACGAAVIVGDYVRNLTSGATFGCAQLTRDCAGFDGSAGAGGANDCGDVGGAAAAAVAAACVGKASCSLVVDSATMGGAPSGTACDGTKRPFALAARVSGCTAAPPAPNASTTGWVFDFGANMAGWARLDLGAGLPSAARPAAGATIVLRYGEVLKPDGSVDQPWGSGAGINQANQTDAYTVRGGDAPRGEAWAPAFTYHGFRYVQVEGLPPTAAPTAALLTAHFVRTAMPKSGHVEFGHTHDASDDDDDVVAVGGGGGGDSYRFGILNEIQAAIVQTQASNVHAHPTDCPQREKRGWTGDSQMTSGECSLNFDAGSMYANWLTAMADSAAAGCALAPAAPAFPQPACFECCDPKRASFGCDYTGLPPGGADGGFSEVGGSIADVVPFMHVGGWPGDPSWGVAGATIPWEVWTATGDVSLLEQHYELAKGEVDFLSRNGNPELGGLVSFGYYGDWLSLQPLPKPQATGWSHLLGIARVADMAEALGKSDDAAALAQQLANLTASYNRAYFKGGSAGDGSRRSSSYGEAQTANVLPLYLNLTASLLPDPVTATAEVASALVAQLRATNNRTQSGIVGTSYLLQALTAAGQHALALSIASATDEPSWGFMVRQGPGTIWETWGDTSNSRNHPALCATIGKYLYAVSGIAPEAWAARDVPELRPGGGDAATAAALGSAAVSLPMQSGAGRLALAWSAGEGRFAANASIPHGFSAAVLELPLPLPHSRAWVLRERHSGLQFSFSGRGADGNGTSVSMELQAAGVLHLRTGPATVELTIVPGDFEFNLVATQ